MTGIRELAVAIRHELGQSMAVVSGYAQLIRSLIEQDSVLSNYLSNILFQINKMEELTVKITSIARYKTTDYLGNEKMIDIDQASGD